MAQLIQNCKQCPHYHPGVEDGTMEKCKLRPLRTIRDPEELPQWCPLPEEDPMST